eukprot:CAMPEP_0184498224 /NCGR_PEP_ID=MMETSP0113_2-20130426/38432_1 /TAXON_ID=91329 /ORGANISM="Norrisiella sphaerica, Strain BC52" /LENGTH=633 /DNA_ID=CAMNT_0026885651 /DNA_START=89 /DNA_END=1990 /DNA_ORIENTATION=+
MVSLFYRRCYEGQGDTEVTTAQHGSRHRKNSISSLRKLMGNTTQKLMAATVACALVIIMVGMTDKSGHLGIGSGDYDEYATFYSSPSSISMGGMPEDSSSGMNNGGRGGYAGSTRGVFRRVSAQTVDIRYPPVPLMWPLTFCGSNSYRCLRDIAYSSPVIVSIGFLGIIGLVLQKATNRAPCGCTFLKLSVLFPPAAIKHGEIWRFFTHTMLHSDVLHLLLNILMITFALDLEGIPSFVSYRSPETPPISVGSTYVMWIVFISCLFSGMGASISTFLAMIQGLSGVCFGLHGAIVGICMCALGYNPRTRHGPFIRGRLYYSCMWMAFDIARALLVTCAGNNNSSTVTFIGHLAGFLGGIVAIAMSPPLQFRCHQKSLPFLGNSGNCVAFSGIPFLDQERYIFTVEDSEFYCLALIICMMALVAITAFCVHSEVRGYEGRISFELCCRRRSIFEYKEIPEIFPNAFKRSPQHTRGAQANPRGGDGRGGRKRTTSPPLPGSNQLGSSRGTKPPLPGRPPPSPQRSPTMAAKPNSRPSKDGKREWRPDLSTVLSSGLLSEASGYHDPSQESHSTNRKSSYRSHNVPHQGYSYLYGDQNINNQSSNPPAPYHHPGMVAAVTPAVNTPASTRTRSDHP